QLSGNVKNSLANSTFAKNGRNLARPFSSKPARNDIIGIDLGTTNSCVSSWKGRRCSNHSIGGSLQPKRGTSRWHSAKSICNKPDKHGLTGLKRRLAKV
ncbi:hypothetical protein IFM89_036877, partial [Coptis chinensis]